MSTPSTADGRSVTMAETAPTPTIGMGTAMTSVATFEEYTGAQALVDRMSDDGFPVQYSRIVGDNLRTVEQVTGRLTKRKAALYGMGTGAWFALLVAFLFGLFLPGPSWLFLFGCSLLLGLIFGALYGYTGHWATRGVRDFSSVQYLSAGSYDVQVTSDLVSRARKYTAR